MPDEKEGGLSGAWPAQFKHPHGPGSKVTGLGGGFSFGCLVVCFLGILLLLLLLLLFSNLSLLLSGMSVHDCLDAYCLGCLICLCFVFLYCTCSRNWACFTRKGALDILFFPFIGRGEGGFQLSPAQSHQWFQNWCSGGYPARGLIIQSQC